MGLKNRFAGTKLARGFETSKDAEENGVWRVHPEFGIHVKIRRSTLIEHKRAIRKHYKPFAHLTRIDPAQELLVKQKAAAEVLVADWGQTQEDADGLAVLDGAGEPIRNPMVDAEGNEIRPSLENVLESFTSMPDFYAWVADESETFEHYRVAVVESAAGNSPSSSPGSASGERQAQAPFSSAVLSEEKASGLSPVVQN